MISNTEKEYGIVILLDALGTRQRIQMILINFLLIALSSKQI
jgi:hypothetical protein